MANAGEGFILYKAPSLSSHDDGASSQFSGYSGGGSSAQMARNNLQSGRPPPPHTATLRTNFTTEATRRSIHYSPSGGDDMGSAGFRGMHTPPPPPTHGAATHQFIEAVAPQQQRASSSMVNMWAILACIILGAALGVLVNQLDVDPAISKWIKLPGDLYIRAIQCIVVPLVFVNLAVSVADIIHIGQGQRIGLRVALLFMLTTVIGIAEGIGVGFLSRVIFNWDNTSQPINKDAVFSIQCNNGNFLEELANGAVTCSALSSTNTTAQFVVNDVNSALVKQTTLMSARGSLTDNLIEIMHMVVPANIMKAFVDNTLLSIVAFAIPCGITVAKSFHGPIQLNPLLEFLREVNESLVMMINWVIGFTPIAVLSLLAGSFGADLDTIMKISPLKMMLNVAGLYTAVVLVHVFIVVPLIFTAFARTNPYKFMRHLVPAYVYSLGCSSSVATLPVSMRCIEMSRSVSNSVMYFVMSIGASINMNGTAIYLPMMVFFLVDVSGLAAEFGTFQICILALASFLGSLAAAPVPAGSLVMLMTVWRITMPSIELPAVYAFLVAADVILDRVVTFCNINGDAMVCRIIEEHVDETITDDILLRAGNHTGMHA